MYLRKLFPGILGLILLFIVLKTEITGQVIHSKEDKHFGVIQYEDNYFSWRRLKNDQWETTFQLSVKKRLFENLCECEKIYPIHFGFTQKALWYWGDGWNIPSWPIVEIRNNPGLFYDLDHLDHGKTGNLHIRGKFGVEHESNGRTGNFSRGWNWLYLQVSTADSIDLKLSTQRPGIRDVGFSLKVLRPFGIDTTNNKDIEKEIGNVVLKFFGPAFLAKKYKGVKNVPIINKFKISYLFSWSSYNFTRSRSLKSDILIGFGESDLWLYVQNWNGTGQWLENYQEKTNTWRFGIIFK